MRPARTVAILFLVAIAAMQACRLLFRWRITVNEFNVPLWPSAIAIVVLLAIAFGLWREGKGES